MKHSRLLSILHYIWGGFWSFYILAFLSAYIFSSERFWKIFRSSICTQEPFLGDSCDRWIIILSISMLLMFATLAITNILSAMNYWRSKAHTVNWVAASLNLISFPLGTVLGLFSLWILRNYLKNLTDKKSE